MYLILWDAKKAERNFQKHGVLFEEAQTVFFSSMAVTLEDQGHGEKRFIVIAFSARLRLLVVVYAYREENEIRIISARKATKKEAQIYEERIRFF